MTEQTDHDQLFKQLIQTFFLDFLELFAPALLSQIQPESIEFLPQEYFTDLLDGDRKAIDLLVKVQLNEPIPRAASGKRQQPIDQMVLIHIENQAISKPDFDQRIFFYFAQLYREHRIPVYPLVVFSFDTPYRLELSQHKVTLPELEVLTFNFHPVQLNRLNWRDFLQSKNPIAAALMAKMKIEQKDRPKVKVECLRLLVTLRLDPARTFLISGFVDNYLRLNATEESNFQIEIAKIKTAQEREDVMQITTSWMEQGVVLGREQGVVLGRRQATEQLVQRSLAHKFDRLPEDLADRLSALPIEQLEDLHDAAMDFNSIEDLINWLAQMMPSKTPNFSNSPSP
jgi:predicted transposase/invertase (TIGR01784 family)